MSPVGLFKANVSHCYQEVTISRTRDLYCHRVCILRDYIALGRKVRVAVRMTIIKGLRAHTQNTHLSTNGRHSVHMNSTWIEINIRCVLESRVQCGDGFGTEGV